MKRDMRLRGLSSEHHHALLLARSLLDRRGEWTPRDGAALLERMRVELEPHFRVEEELLLPALGAAGAMDLVQRTLEDHAFLRASAEEAARGSPQAAYALGERLHAHVRFEESEVFPACEALLAPEVLDEVGRRASSAH
ncbi:hemerythrin domain-containing protein [Archangium gephyra]|uniref:hemerythrin domain-containing protein n=1 Tax=Archangium gephyra TaxID=48 RepID=UPI0035D3F553